MSIQDFSKNFIKHIESNTVDFARIKKSMSNATKELSKAKDAPIAQGTKLVKQVAHHPLDTTKSILTTGGKILVSTNLILQGAKFVGNAATNAVYGNSKPSENPKVDKSVEQASSAAVAETVHQELEKSELVQVSSPSTQPAAPQMPPLPNIPSPKTAENIKTTPAASTPQSSPQATASGYIKAEILSTEKSFNNNLSNSIAAIKVLKEMQAKGKLETTMNLDEALTAFERARDASNQLVNNLGNEADLKANNKSNQEVGEEYSNCMREYGNAMQTCVQFQQELNHLTALLNKQDTSENLDKGFAEKFANTVKSEYESQGKELNGADFEKFKGSNQDALQAMNSGFISPVQRMPRHRLLLEDLEKKTPEGERQELSTALEIVKNSALQINTLQLQNDMKKVEDAVKHLENPKYKLKYDEGLITPERRNFYTLPTSYLFRSAPTEGSQKALTNLLGDITELSKNEDPGIQQRLGKVLNDLGKSSWAKSVMNRDPKIKAQFQKLEKEYANKAIKDELNEILGFLKNEEELTTDAALKDLGRVKLDQLAKDPASMEVIRADPNLAALMNKCNELS